MSAVTDVWRVMIVTNIVIVTPYNVHTYHSPPQQPGCNQAKVSETLLQNISLVMYECETVNTSSALHV